MPHWDQIIRTIFRVSWQSGSSTAEDWLVGCQCLGLGDYLMEIYLVRVSEIGRYFSWLLLCDRACLAQSSAFFLSRVLLLGFGKLLSIKKKCHCRFVVTCVGFTTNCQNKSRSKSLPPDIHALLFLHATTHTVALAGIRVHRWFCSRWNSLQVQSTRVATAIPVVAWFSAWRRQGRRKWHQKFPLSSNLHSLLSPDLNSPCSSEGCRDGNDE